MKNKHNGPPSQLYVFDNAGQQAAARFAALSAMFDPGTIRHLEQHGIGQGSLCVEIAAGGGSIAVWLSERVGPGGHILATDIDTRFLESLQRPNLEVRRHDIATDPLPEAAFDLVHARLVLGHLPEREKALAHMVAALNPRGWLLVEDFDALSIRPDPTVNPVEVSLNADFSMHHLMTERGVDLRYGRLLAGRLRAHGLIDVGAEGRMFMWEGGSLGANLLRMNCEQLQRAIIESGSLTEQEFQQDLRRLDEAEFMRPSPVMWAAWGRRPSK